MADDIKHAGGRPVKFASVEELQEKIDVYFADCKENRRPYTITGLALALDTNRQTLVNYEEKDEFFDTIKRAKSQCENYLEEGMLTNKLNSTASIFNAKNNYGWQDRTEATVINKQGDLTDDELDEIIAVRQQRKNSEETS